MWSPWGQSTLKSSLAHIPTYLLSPHHGIAWLATPTALGLACVSLSASVLASHWSPQPNWLLVIWFILLFRSENFSSESSIKPVGSSKEKSSCVCFVLLINQFSYRKTIIVSAWSIDVRTKWSVRKSRVDPPGQERHKSWTAAVQHLFDRGLLLSSRYVLYMYDPVLPMVQMVREISVPYINVYYAKSCMVIIMLIIWNLNRK